MFKKLYLLLFVLIITIFYVTGCSSSKNSTQWTPSSNGSTVSRYLVQQRALVAKIQNDGVQITQVGDTLTLILPSDHFFEAGTPQLNRNYYPVLNQIAVLLRHCEKFSIKIAGFTDNRGWPLRNIALSRAQAFAIANYLWAHGIDSRLMSSVGYGDAMPVADNHVGTGQALNRRVEISLRLLTDPDDM